MEIVISWLIYIFAALATLPFLTFLIVYFVALRITHHKKHAIQWAMDLTTIWLIIAVGALWQYVWNSFFGWWAVLSLLLLFYLLLLLLQIWIKGNINWGRLGRGGWRLSFVMFSALYVIFFLVGIGQTFFLHAD